MRVSPVAFFRTYVQINIKFSLKWETIQKEAVEALLSQDRAGVDISMRLGKTVIGLSVAQKFNI